MKSLLTLSAASLLLIGGIASCSLEERINDLDDRVSTLEKQIQDVKSDMSSLREIVDKLQSSVTIDNIVEDENGYTTLPLWKLTENTTGDLNILTAA